MVPHQPVYDLPSAGQVELPISLIGLATSCDMGDLDEAARAVIARVTERSGGYVCLCNVHLLTLSTRDAPLRNALGGAWKRFPDGAPVAWLQRKVGYDGARRIGGPDLMPRVVDIGREAGVRHFLFGSTPAVTLGVDRALRERCPGAEIVGRYSPPFSTGGEVEPSSIAAIAAARPDIVWCALGAPKQELWMHEAAPMLPGVVLLGVGAAFDFLAGTKKRAPGWMRDSGFEWAHRLASEPARLGGRYLKTNTEFLLRAGIELTRQRLRAWAG